MGVVIITGPAFIEEQQILLFSNQEIDSFLSAPCSGLVILSKGKPRMGPAVLFQRVCRPSPVALQAPGSCGAGPAAPPLRWE